MGNLEKRLVTNCMFCIAAYAGYMYASCVYELCMSGYLKIFHKAEWDKAIK